MGIVWARFDWTMIGVTAFDVLLGVVIVGAVIFAYKRVHKDDEVD